MKGNFLLIEKACMFGSIQNIEGWKRTTRDTLIKPNDLRINRELRDAENSVPEE